MDQHAISAAGLSAVIKADGAELCSLRGPDKREMLWQAGPAWPRHAPVLFPIVGRLTDDTLRHAGKSYRMTQHGFARDMVFAWAERTPTRARLVLNDDATTRAKYPFAFRFELTYAADEKGLSQIFSVTNTGDEMLPASFGAHPAFIWPLVPGIDQMAHTLTFDADEPASIRRVSGGLLRPEALPTPIDGRTLALSESLFDDDAVILEAPASRSVRFTAPGAPILTVAWEGMPSLGIWSKPGGAGFLCIEPWHGIASPASFDGAFSDKPGLALIAPGETVTGRLTMTIT